MGTTLKNSPTLAACIQISLPSLLFLEGKQNFSRNLFLCSFFFINLTNIIKGEKRRINIIKIW